MHLGSPEPTSCLCDSEPQCTPIQLGSGTPETTPSHDTHTACDYSVLPGSGPELQTPGSEMDVYQGASWTMEPVVRAEACLPARP